MSTPFLQASAISAGLVGLAEVGDRTQLLGVVLVVRYRRPLTILAGVLAATIANHLLAASVGALAGERLHGPWLKWVLGGSFLLFAVVSLMPEKAGAEDEAPKLKSGRGVFLTTVMSFFVLEMGDKTQIATTVLAARFASVGAVVAGSTLGMMLANAPSVVLGHALGGRLPLRWLNLGAAALSAAMGVWTLLS